jgi:hypothetical protein
MALEPYPFADDAQIDPRLLFALDNIAGICAGVRTHIHASGIAPNHVASPICWCNPVPDDQEPDVWIHNYQPTQHAARQGEDA